jgi:SpoIID/LytB domain protein
VYAGLAKERRPGARSWTDAVDATTRQVLVWRGGPIMAKYSSTNGGASVAGSAPYLRAVADRDDAVSPYHRWQVGFPLTTLAGIFTSPGELIAATRVADGVVFDWTASDGTTGQFVVPVVDFRSRVNGSVPAPAGLPLALPSVRFDLASSDGVATAIGRGWGHGIGMSQYGALGKALRGMKAPDILAGYYGGLRPVAVPPEQLPTTIRVALDEGRASASVSGGNRFRVLDGAGNVIALAARGTWQVLPAGTKGVRVVPPADQVGGPGVDQVRLERAVARLGEPGRLHVRLAAPAALQLVVQLPATPPAVTELGVRDPGMLVLDVPPATEPGTGQVTVRADAGGGRTTVVPLAFEVARPLPPPAAAAVDGLVPVGPGDSWLSALALALLVVVVAGVARGHRQLH